MSALKQRLIKLESTLSVKAEDIHIMRFIVDCSGIEPIGYRCGDVEIMRRYDESEQEFKTQCKEAVYWPIDENFRHIFHPIYAD
jgi:hypothetical protein